MSRRTIETLENVAADHELLGDLSGDREARRRNKVSAQRVRKLVDRMAHKRDLVRLERSIALGGQRISRQKGLIARIEGLGADATRARDLLAVFEKTQSLFEEHRERLLGKEKVNKE